MKRKLLALLVLPFWVFLAVGIQAQEEEDLGELSLQSRRMLEEGRALYDGAEFARAIQALDKVLAEFDTWAAGTLPVEEEEVRIEAYRLRGLAYYNLGEANSAKADFAVLLRQEPDHELDRKLLSPKIIAAFEQVRSEVTGMLTVTSDPLGADVRLGGRALGVTPLEPVRIAVGRYLLDVEKRGFSLIHESVEVVAGESTTLDYPMHRNARSVTVMTSPTGAGISVDGEPLGMSNGSPPPGYEIELMEQGLNPANVSAPFTIPFLAAGGHVLRVEKDCFEVLEGDFQVTLAGGELPLELETIVLRPSRSTLRISSTPSGASVRLNGRPVGTTPLEIGELCGEEILVQMKMEHVGSWENMVPLEAGKVLDVEGELHLSLASLGVVREVGVEDSSLDAWDEYLTQVVGEQKSYAGQIAEVTSDEISPAHLELFRQVQAADGGIPLLDDDLRRRLRDELEADLFLVASPAGRTRGVLYLFGMQRAKPDILSVESLSARGRQHVVEVLEQVSLNATTWSGLITVDTGDSDFPFVVRRSPSAPEGTTLLPGDRIRSVDGRPVTSRLDLESEFSRHKPGSRVPVSIERGEAMVSATVVAAETPVFTRPGTKGVLTNKVLADLERRLRVATDDRQENLAALGIGIAYLVGDEPGKALSEGFDRCSLASGSGISAGTLEFLRGVSLEALGSSRQAEAASAFKRAAGEREATLWRDDGPLVAPLAAARSGSQGSR
jgi:hypothetical protein